MTCGGSCVAPGRVVEMEMASWRASKVGILEKMGERNVNPCAIGVGAYPVDPFSDTVAISSLLFNDL